MRARNPSRNQISAIAPTLKITLPIASVLRLSARYSASSAPVAFSPGASDSITMIPMMKRTTLSTPASGVIRLSSMKTPFVAGPATFSDRR